MPLKDPGPLAERWLLPSRIFDGEAGTLVDESAMLASLEEVRVVYVAEKHNSPHDHAVQLRIIDAMFNQNPSMAVGMEMIKRPFQKPLDDYIAKRIDEDALLEGVEWEDRWGFNFALYRPIFRYCREHGIPIVALNARDELTRKVARQGLDSLDEDEKNSLPELDLDVSDHREMVKEAFGMHGQDATDHADFSFDNFYAAQVIWDETMAHEVHRALSSEDAPARMVVLAGSGHVRYRFGIPDRVERRGTGPARTVIPFLLRSDGPQKSDFVGRGVGDYLWVMAVDEASLPE